MKTMVIGKLRETRGITLVEILIAVVLGAVAAAVLFATFLGGQDVFIKTRNETGNHGDARVVLGLLASEIRSAGSDAGELGLPGQGIALARGDSLHLMSDLNGDRTIGLSEPPEDVLYVYDSTAGFLTRDTGAGPIVLLDRIASLNLQFLDTDGQPIAAEANGRVDVSLIRAVEIDVSIRNNDGTTQDLEGVYTFRAR